MVKKMQKWVNGLTSSYKSEAPSNPKVRGWRLVQEVTIVLMASAGLMLLFIGSAIPSLTLASPVVVVCAFVIAVAGIVGLVANYVLHVLRNN